MAACIISLKNDDTRNNFESPYKASITTRSTEPRNGELGLASGLGLAYEDCIAKVNSFQLLGCSLKIDATVLAGGTSRRACG